MMSLESPDNIVNLLQNIHNEHPIASPWGWAMGRLCKLIKLSMLNHSNYHNVCNKYRITFELPWIKFFGSWVCWFAHNFHGWWSHKWKLFAKCITSDPKIVIHGNECIILFFTCYFVSWTCNTTKNNYRSLILPLSLRTVFSDLAFWHEHSWSVMSSEHGVLVLSWHIHWLLLHVQIGTKVVFTE